MAAELRTLQRDADPELIEVVEGLLARVRSGETTGVVVAEQQAKDGNWFCCGIKDRFKTTGYLFHLMHKLQEDD